MKTFDAIVEELKDLSIAEMEELQELLERMHADKKRKEMLSKMEVVKSNSYDEAKRLRDKLT